MAYGQAPRDVRKDEEGLASMKNLGENMVYLFNALDKPKKRRGFGMKRFLTLLLTACLCSLLTACYTNRKNSSSEPATVSSTTKDASQNSVDGTHDPNSSEGGHTTQPQMKILIAYFSCTGTTEKIAQHIAGHIKADVYKITPEIPYTSDDLNYTDSSTRATREQRDSSARPAISGTVENLSDYDCIFLGYPIWHGEAPKVIYTFLESYDFSGKTIIPFCTSHSSGIGSSDTKLHALCSDSTKWISGKRFGRDTWEEDIIQWTNSLPLSLK